MTREEFLNDVTDFYELTNFCNEEGCSYCEDVWSYDSMYDYINDEVVTWAREYDWDELRDKLNNIDTGYSWYRLEYGEFTGLDDSDFNGYKDDVLDWADENDLWDDEDYYEEEPAIENDEPDEEEYDIEDEPLSITELICACSSDAQKIEITEECSIEILIA